MVLRERVEKALAELRPYIRGHGGDVDLVSIEGGIVTVRLTGACIGCPMSIVTLRTGIESFLRKEVPEVREVRAAPDLPEDEQAAEAGGPATAELRKDHREALHLFDALERAATALPDKGPIPVGVRAEIDAAASFIATKLPLHFRREDEVLFPSLDLPLDTGPLAIMAWEHEVIENLGGRAFPAAYASMTTLPTPDAATIGKFRRIVRELALVLREHIQKEDHIIFPIADQRLDKARAAEIAERMAAMKEASWLTPV